jgi:hypothetical protein
LQVPAAPTPTPTSLPSSAAAPTAVTATPAAASAPAVTPTAKLPALLISKVSFGKNSGSSGASAAQSVTLYNSTDQPLAMAGWRLTDGTHVLNIGTGNIAPKSTFVFTWPAASELSPVGGHLVLQNPAKDPSGTAIDSVSWGNDATQLKPSVATTSNTVQIARKTLTADTNTANDWQ